MAAITQFRESVRSLVVAEFNDVISSRRIRHDKLHESLGQDGAIVGIYPEREGPSSRGIEQIMLISVQVFDQYDLMIDPSQTVDPAKIEGWAWRLQQRFQQSADPGTNAVWFYNVAEINYPDDPTGNKTRFIMTVEGFGQNPTMIETSG